MTVTVVVQPRGLPLRWVVFTAIIFALLAASLGLGGSAQAAEWRKSPTGKVSQKQFGMHTFQGKPEVESGAVRTACLGRWAEIQPKRGEWNWRTFDAEVAKLESYGYSRILYTFCDAPAWAARAFGEPNQLSDWRTFVRAVVTRYKGRFDAYEAFNAATSRFWYQGTPKRMAKMTNIVFKAVQAIDPQAKVVSASSQIHRPDWLQNFLPPYLKHLKKRGWPIDVMAFHAYTLYSPFDRPDTIEAALKTYRKAQPPGRIKLWDTEVNYPNDDAPRHAAALVARTYIDSWRYGFERTYWYMWTQVPDDFIGVELLPGSVATAAYRKFHGWTAQAKMRKCQDTDRLVACRFSDGSRKFTLAYAKSKSTKVKLASKKTVCPVSAQSCSKERKYRLGKVPVRITGHPGIQRR